MPAGTRIDPYLNFRFKLKIDELGDVASFAEATIADSTTDAVDYREGTEETRLRKLSGLTKYGNITLKKGLTDSMALYDWRKLVVEKGASVKDSRRNISIILMDEEGKDKATWNVVAAWPSKYDPSDLNAKGNEVLIETFELVHEGITRVQ